MNPNVNRRFVKKGCKTGKKQFDQVGAMIALAGRQHRDKGERRFYRCQFCGLWHLTSQSKKR